MLLFALVFLCIFGKGGINSESNAPSPWEISHVLLGNRFIPPLGFFSSFVIRSDLLKASVVFLRQSLPLIEFQQAKTEILNYKESCHFMALKASSD